MVVVDEKIFHFDVLGLLGTRDIAIFGKRQSTHIVLIDNVVLILYP
jgi:hypothetical protein